MFEFYILNIENSDDVETFLCFAVSFVLCVVKVQLLMA